MVSLILAVEVLIVLVLLVAYVRTRDQIFLAYAACLLLFGGAGLAKGFGLLG